LEINHTITEEIMLQDVRNRGGRRWSGPPGDHSPARRTLVALVQDRPGVLNRAVSLFRRRAINIETLAIARTRREGISCMTCVVETSDVDGVLRQLGKLIEVLDVRETADPLSFDINELLDELLPAEAQADGVP